MGSQAFQGSLRAALAPARIAKVLKACQRALPLDALAALPPDSVFRLQLLPFSRRGGYSFIMTLTHHQAERIHFSHVSAGMCSCAAVEHFSQAKLSTTPGHVNAPHALKSKKAPALSRNPKDGNLCSLIVSPILPRTYKAGGSAATNWAFGKEPTSSHDRKGRGVANGNFQYTQRFVHW